MNYKFSVGDYIEFSVPTQAGITGHIRALTTTANYPNVPAYKVEVAGDATEWLVFETEITNLISSAVFLPNGRVIGVTQHGQNKGDGGNSHPPKSTFCSHSWKTYNSGWTSYEYCEHCDIKKSDYENPPITNDDLLEWADPTNWWRP